MNYFDENYPDYLAQNPTKKLDFYLKTINKYSNKKSIFEIGFGKGLFLEYATKHGYKVQGCDINQDAINEVKRRLPKVNLFKEHFEKIDLSNLDIVAAFDVIEHIPDIKEFFNTLPQ